MILSSFDSLHWQKDTRCGNTKKTT